MATITDFSSNKTVFMTNIPKNYREDDLKKFIIEQLKNASSQNEQCTNVVEFIKIKRKQLSEYNVAYVIMNTRKNAKKSIELLNGMKLSETSPLKVMLNSTNVCDKSIGFLDVMVKGIKKDVETTKIKELFQEYGKIMSFKLVVEDGFQFNKYAYVSFKHYYDFETILMQHVIKEMKKEIGEESFVIEKHSKQSKKKTIINYFKQFGNIDAMNGKLCVNVIFDEKRNKNKCFINYSNPESSLLAIQSTNNQVIDELGGLELHSYFYKNKEELERQNFEIEMNLRTKYKDCCIYLSSVDDELTVKDIHDKLGENEGEKHFYEIQFNINPRSPGLNALVCLYSHESAIRAINRCEELNNGWSASYFKHKSPYPKLPNFVNHYNTMIESVRRQDSSMGHAFPRRQDSPMRKKRQMKQKLQQPEPTSQQPEPVNDEKLISVIGEQIYDYVEKLGKYDEDLIVRITVVFLESFDFKELEGKLKNPEQELTPIIYEIADTLKNMAQDE
ncbi:Polyadenylate-binding protein [Entamoeba marina]